MAYKLTESTVGLIVAHLKANMPAALLAIRTDRADARVTTEPPNSYFIFEKARGYRPPAVFVIFEQCDFRLGETGPNFINALETGNVTVLIEDKDRESLTIKAWRYQAALAQLLTNTSLTNGANTVKLVTKVVRNSFSPIYSNAKDEESSQAVFRKEIVLELEVEHYEQL